MTRAEYEKGIRRPARCSMAVVILALIASVTDLIFLVRGSGEFSHKQRTVISGSCCDDFNTGKRYSCTKLAC